MNTDYPSIVVTTMTTPDRTVTDDNNILTAQASAESQPTSIQTLRSDESRILLQYKIIFLCVKRTKEEFEFM